MIKNRVDFMERLFYDKKVAQFTTQMPTLASKLGIELDNRYLHYHNDICPSCLGKFQLSHDRTVRGVGAFATAILTNEYKKLIPYVICKPCSLRQSKDKATQIEDYIIDVLQLEK